MSAGYRFAVSKINTLSRQGQGNLPLLFFVRKFFAVQYRCIFCRETATLSTTSVTAKIRESFLPVQFCGKSVLKSVAHSVATKYVGRSSVCCQQNKYVIEARAGQPAFAFFCAKIFCGTISVHFLSGNCHAVHDVSHSENP